LPTEEYDGFEIRGGGRRQAPPAAGSPVSGEDPGAAGGASGGPREDDKPAEESPGDGMAAPPDQLLERMIELTLYSEENLR